MGPASLDVDDLRQGDICMIDIFPAWDHVESPRIMTGKRISGVQLSAWPKISRAASDGTSVLVSVCSYDCDLENPRSRWGVALAPLIPLSRQRPDYENLLSCGTPIVDGENISYTYLNSFPYPENPSFFDGGNQKTAAIADFSAISHMGKAKDVIELLKSRVIYRLDDATRRNFQTKVAMFMARF